MKTQNISKKKKLPGYTDLIIFFIVLALLCLLNCYFTYGQVNTKSFELPISQDKLAEIENALQLIEDSQELDTSKSMVESIAFFTAVEPETEEELQLEGWMMANGQPRWNTDNDEYVADEMIREIERAIILEELMIDPTFCCPWNFPFIN